MLASARAMRMRLARLPVLAATLAPAALFAALNTVLTFVNAGGGGSENGPVSSTSVAALERADGLVAGLHSATTLLGVISLAICAWAIASDFANGTIRNLLVRQPSRLRLLAGNMLALGGLLAAMAIVATAAAVFAALAVAPGQEIATDAWSTGQVLTAALQTVLALLGYGLLGTVLALAFRSSAAAIGVGVAYALPIESILGSVGSAADDVLPGKLLSAVADGSASALQITIVLAWVAVALLAARSLFAGRDITA